MANKFLTPEISYLGENALEDSEKDIIKLGKKALIVSGNSMIRQGNLDKLTEILKRNSIEYTTFTTLNGEPYDSLINEGYQLYNIQNCDFIIGFGGGTPLDAAKAIGILVSNGGELSDYMGKNLEKKLPPIVAIPSTAGTGSEVTPFTIITDTDSKVKMLLKGEALIPKIAIVDPKFTYQMPKNVTAATGLDALTHAVESYTSKKSFPISDIFAESAIKRIFKYLPLAYKNGDDKKARQEMALASYEAGLSFSNSSVTIVHGMSRPIGALFHVPHGISNAMLIATCLDYVKEGAFEKFAKLARLIGVSDNNEEDIEACSKFIEAISDLCKICEIPSLKEYGIDEIKYRANIEKMAIDAINSGSPANTMIDLNKNDLVEIYNKLIAID